jgi:esterase/lipase superfamily enzyme
LPDAHQPPPGPIPNRKEIEARLIQYFTLTLGLSKPISASTNLREAFELDEVQWIECAKGVNRLPWTMQLGVSLAENEIRSVSSVSDLASLMLRELGRISEKTKSPAPQRPGTLEAAIDPEPRMRGAYTPETDIEYPVWYGTNRLPNDSTDHSKGYSSERDTKTHYGRCKVFIPTSHKIGSLGSSWLRRFVTGVDDRLRLKTIGQLTEDLYWADLRNSLKKLKPDERHAIVFVHGFNVSFEDAALRAAQIGCDLSLDAVMAFFSWPSKGSLQSYIADGASIEASEPNITEFLVDFVQKSGASSVHIIAHSMGNRGVLRAINNIANRAQSLTKVTFGQIILAAADVDSTTFRNLCGAYVSLAKRTTMYVSKRDRAVEAAKWLYDFARAGLQPPVVVVPGIDTINVTNVDLTMLGHGYIGTARDVLQDIQRLLRYSAPPDQRCGLRKEAVTVGEPFWTIGK